MAQKSDAVLDEVNATAHEIKKEKLIEKLSTVLDNSNDTVSEGKKLIQQLRDSPSDLLFKSKSSPSSVEE